jgi:serine/threonine protein kinase
VAIKFLGEEFSRHPKALISLQREAKKSQQLAHPNVLTVYDFDRDGDRVYMTMEMLQGDALSGLKKITFAEGKEPSNETLIEQMASGLAYAHENGLVHSDFKPDNVFVTTEGRVKILDFGIARIMDSAVQKDSFDAGELGAMTLRYASLEMLRRDSDPHPADDVYALGLIAYQLYAGSHPYGGRTALDALEQGLKPEPIKGIKRYQWRAIAGAIALERVDRTPSAEQFLKEFSGTSRRNRILMAMAVRRLRPVFRATAPATPAPSSSHGQMFRAPGSLPLDDAPGSGRWWPGALPCRGRRPGEFV